MILFEFFLKSKLIQIYTLKRIKLHHLKIFSGKHAPKPPNKAHGFAPVPKSWLRP